MWRSETTPSLATSRRDLIAGALGALSAASLGGVPTKVAAQAAKPFRIDVHHHLSPPTLITELAKAKLGNKPAYDWTPQRSIDDMDKAGIAVSLTSITTPAVAFLPVEQARIVARECNDYGAKLRDDHKGRFGMFVNLPLPDIDGTLKEIAYGLDTLHADGVAMLTSYGDSWLGHPKYAPVFEELNRRKAVVYTHPTSANCCRNILPYPDTLIEYGTDTTRAIADIVFSGAARKYRDIKFIFSHAGGTMPFLAERFVVATKFAPPGQKQPMLDAVPDGVEAELKRFYYDTAQATHPAALAAFQKFIPLTQLVFGTDYPYRTGAENVAGLAAFGFSPAELAGIERGNALQLMPQWA